MDKRSCCQGGEVSKVSAQLRNSFDKQFKQLLTLTAIQVVLALLSFGK